jgi:dTDP-glucose 4,6-dehydratase
MDARYVLEKIDICDDAALRRVFVKYAPQAVIHLAAESHVDRSIDSPADLIRTNVVGTFMPLQEALRHWRGLDMAGQKAFRLLHID